MGRASGPFSFQPKFFLLKRHKLLRKGCCFILASSQTKEHEMPLTLFKYWTYQFFSPGVLAKKKYEAFKKILVADRQAHVYMAQIEEIYYDQKDVDCFRVQQIYDKLSKSVKEMVDALMELAPLKYGNLKDYYKKIDFYCRFLMEPKYYDIGPPFVLFSGNEKDSISNNLVGGKGYNLFRLTNDLKLPVPKFFIITTHAFFYLLECLDLVPVLKKELSQVDISDPESLEAASESIRAHFRSVEFPLPLELEIKKAVQNNFPGSQDTKFSVRSSAVAEDSSSSFAGQYLSVLGVGFSGLLRSYKKVVESKYMPNSIYYRVKKGFCDLETPMAVIVQEMIEPLCAGVIYSRDPENPINDNICIYSAEGQGEKVVSGKVRPVQISVNRKTMEVQGGPYLCTGFNETIAVKLANWIMETEKNFGGPVDMEWCLDKEHGLQVLQARPLVIKQAINNLEEKKEKRLPKAPFLKGGKTASRGCAVGAAFKVRSRSDLFSVPKGAILVSRTAPPDFVMVFDRIVAMVTDEGSPASHCASVAREMGIPYICGLKDAYSKLDSGTTYSVDADKCSIYLGRISDCQPRGERPCDIKEEERPISVMLKQLLNLACHLGLVDPNSKDFRPEGCRSLHDIIRLVHETAMKEMFALGRKGGITGKGTKRLKDGLPLLFYVLDVGGGISDEAGNLENITIDHITSVPMVAFWKGLTDPSIKWSEAEHFAWGDYDNIMLAGGVMSKDSAQLSSYAVLAHDYMNLNVRFGYHFVQIDALCTNEPENNYISFRFSGGGGSPEGRLLRTQFLVFILQRLGFEASSTGELVDGRIKKVSKERAINILEEIGRLVGATRLMDMYLKPEINVKSLAEDFLRGRSDFSTVV